MLADVRIGAATVPAHENGGFALPGGGTTQCREQAAAVASRLDEIISSVLHAREVAQRNRPNPLTVTRRKVARYRPIHNLV